MEDGRHLRLKEKTAHFDKKSSYFPKVQRSPLDLRGGEDSLGRACSTFSKGIAC